MSDWREQLRRFINALGPLWQEWKRDAARSWHVIARPKLERRRAQIRDRFRDSWGMK